ncbi:hypothetical protein G7074_25890 [Pedobacter sp. HDW13]|uniref:hypothetical protein n=1 Tax=Pedobacter sp. HDW13 TaxID=2714940 RepID=UPI00140922DA|nr:hypothetical protein [Pedobacter sp. HDW13]QIL42391.1 hypothetical protein G7074_25890 [Pedobacter sp. HDW13]
MTKLEIIKEAVNRYLMEQFGYKKNIAEYCRYSTNLQALTKKIDLYLRFIDDTQILKNPTIIIARIEFKEQQKGHGKRLLAFLCTLADEHGFSFIEMEGCTKNGAAFSEAFGFYPTGSQRLHWRTSVDDLKTALAKH